MELAGAYVVSSNAPAAVVLIAFTRALASTIHTAGHPAKRKSASIQTCILATLHYQPQSFTFTACKCNNGLNYNRDPVRRNSTVGPNTARYASQTSGIISTAVKATHSFPTRTEDAVLHLKRPRDASAYFDTVRAVRYYGSGTRPAATHTLHTTVSTRPACWPTYAAGGRGLASLLAKAAPERTRDHTLHTGYLGVGPPRSCTRRTKNRIRLL